MTGKHSILVRNNVRPQRNILHDTEFNLPETSINQGQEVLTKLYGMLEEIFKESDRVHACPAVATPQQREEYTHQPHGAVVTYTEDSDSYDKDILMPKLIYPEDFNNEEDDPHESLNNPPSSDPNSEPGPPSKKPTKEPKSESGTDTLS